LYSILDIESNGGAFGKEDIIEIAIYRFDGHKVVDQFASLVNSKGEISPYVQKLTKITPKMLKTSPKFHEIAKRIVEITDNSVLVGHNVSFDYRMLRQSFRSLGYEYTRETIDTISLAKELIPSEESYSLGNLSKSLGIPITNRHRASGDARATLELFKILISKDKKKEILQYKKNQEISKKFINKISKLTENLPSGSGIIYFQSSEGDILHSTYSSNIYRSAVSFFNSKGDKWNEIKNSIEQISYEFIGNKLLSKIIALQKNKRKSIYLPFGLYYKNKNYVIEKTNGQIGDILRFKSFSQGEKVKLFIEKDRNFLDNPAELINILSLENRNELWISKEISNNKYFLILEEGKFSAYGFYQFYNQIESLEKINKLKIGIEKMDDVILNELKLSLLGGNFDIKKLPKK